MIYDVLRTHSHAGLLAWSSLYRGLCEVGSNIHLG